MTQRIVKVVLVSVLFSSASYARGPAGNSGNRGDNGGNRGGGFQQPSRPAPQPPVFRPAPSAPQSPRIQQPSQPRIEQPRQPRIEQPRQPRIEQPRQPRIEQPRQPRIEQPRQPRIEQPRQPRIEQPRQQTPTRPLRDMNPGETRTRRDGSTDKVHKDGRGFTHTERLPDGSFRRESIRRTQDNREVKISDTYHRRNGDVVTQYNSGIRDTRTRDGLRIREDRFGSRVYEDRRASDSYGRRTIYRDHYRNQGVRQYTSIYINYNYYGYPVYFYQPYSPYFVSDYYLRFVVNPWSAPVYYNWGWSYSPWYGYYFSNYPVYYSASYWLTDYMIAQLLQEKYERLQAQNESENAAAQQYEFGNASRQNSLSQAVKEEIRVQVERSVKEQQLASQQQRAMDPTQTIRQGRLMVVAEALEVMDQSQNNCTLDEGDVLRLQSEPGVSGPTAQLQVVSAKATSCDAGNIVTLSTTQLVELENSFQTKIQEGLKELNDKKVGVR